MIVTNGSFPGFYQSLPGELYNWVQFRKYFHQRHENWSYRQYARNAIGNLRYLRRLNKPRFDHSCVILDTTQLIQDDLFGSGSASDTPTKVWNPILNRRVEGWSLFIDWLDVYQDHSGEIAPREGAFFEIDAITGEYRRLKQPPIKHPGSYSTSIQVVVSGSRVRVSGNPSKYNRVDNLFGHTSIDSAMAVFNQVLLTLNYPPFTKCSKVMHKQAPDGHRAISYGDGATFQRIDITENRSVGEGNTLSYLKAVSSQSFRRSVPQLYTNGRTVDWKSQKGNARMIYPTIYDKAHEIDLHQLPKIKKSLGVESPEYLYLKSVRDYCSANGVVRFEQKLKSEFLRKNNLAFWGLFKESDLDTIHQEFLAIDEKLQVTAMTFENISERLIRLGIVESTKAANTTAMYAIQWMTGMEFDQGKSQVKIHRSRLRQIGIDIARPCDLSRHSPVYIRKSQEITVTSLPVPDWYQLPNPSHLKLVA